MCLAPEAVADAITIGADVEKAVCGNPDGECCPFYPTCAYQRQKTAVAAADVVIAAHNVCSAGSQRSSRKTSPSRSQTNPGGRPDWTERETKLAGFARTCSGIRCCAIPMRCAVSTAGRAAAERAPAAGGRRSRHVQPARAGGKSTAGIRGDRGGRVGQP